MGYRHLLAAISLGIIFQSCGNNAGKNDKTTKERDSLAIREQYKESEMLDAEKAIESMVTEPGLKIELVAAEPLVIAPVAMTFDNKGRMWVVEMTGYMPDTTGNGEEALDGKIVILEDTNHDGRMDSRKVFMDSLILPRSICLIDDGILIAEPPRLWFAKIKDDKPVNKVLVDDKYAEGGNVEHQPNGLLRAMDNWIYNAKSDKRYRLSGNKWLIEHTHFRGQWGITQDNFGRLFYNNNSENILGDYFSPGLGAENTHQQRVAGYDEKIIRDNRTYPLRANTGVNRGYLPETLNDSLRLVNFTAACGPLIYRSSFLGSQYNNNGFVAEPSANLIKRNIIGDSGVAVKGRQAYSGKEFVASTDERFRPVNLYTGIDGAMYVLDMYRGIIQHKTYLTPYLKNEIRMRNLTLPLNCGRIYRIVPASGKRTETIVGTDPQNLVKLLSSDNGTVRDLAQQTIIDLKAKEVAPALRELLAGNNAVVATHALWTLEGLNLVTAEEVITLLRSGNRMIRAQAIAVIPSVISPVNQAKIWPALATLQNDSADAINIALLLGSVRKFNPKVVTEISNNLLRTYPKSLFIADAIISTAKDREDALASEPGIKGDTAAIIYKRLEKLRKDIANKKNATQIDALTKMYPRGGKVFTTVCQTCHGSDGEGIQSLAPPLNKSNWVTGSPDQLSRIILYGLTGPVDVNGKLYKAPEINGDMPGIGSNDEFNDEDIAQLMSFLRSAWSNKASKVSVADIQKIRKENKDRQKPFTMQELNSIK